MRDQLGVELGQNWTMADVNKRIPWGKFRSYQRFHYLLGAVFKLMDRGEWMPAMALVRQGLKAVHQATLDNGDWKIA